MTEAMLSEFDYFAPIPVQAMIEDEYEHAISLVSPASGNSALQFSITGEPKVYRDLSNSYLEVQCRITKATGADLDADTAVAPVNLLLHSLFSNVTITVCGTQITEKGSLYHYRAFIESLLTYNGETLQMRESLAGWALDKSPGKLDSILLATANAVTPNPAFLERAKWCADSKIMTLVGRLHADVFHQDLDIPPSCDIHITLDRNPTAVCIMAAADATHKVQITDAKLYVRSKLASADLVSAHRTMLEKTPFRLPHTRVDMSTHQIPAGVTTHSINNLFSGKKTCPKRMIVGLIENARMAGKTELNPFLFGHHNLKAIGAKVGATAVPRTALTMDFSVPHGGSRAYLSTLNALGKDVGNGGTVLTPELWQSAYNFYAFKLVPGPIDNGPVVTPMQSADVSLNLTFSAPTTEVLTVLVYAESTGLYEIDKLNRLIQT